MFEETFIDPFSITNSSPRPFNFATGVMVTEVSKTNLLNVHVDRKAMLQKFLMIVLLCKRVKICQGKASPILFQSLWQQQNLKNQK